MTSFEMLAALHYQNEEQDVASVAVGFRNQAAGRLRDAEYNSDDEFSQDEEDDDDDSEAETLRSQDQDLPLVFLGTTIRRERQPQGRSRRLLSVVTTEDMPEQSNETGSEGPPTPWRTSSAKQRIIDELKDITSDIHLLVGQYTATDFSKVNFRQILQKYAGNKQYKMSSFRENIKRLLVHLLKKTGPFKAEQVEPWYTSAKNVSRAYSLLFALYMEPNHSQKIRGMSAEQIWKSHPQFQLYELEKFKTYNKNMQILTAKRKAMISDEEASFARDALRFPREDKTSRGIPFWHTHAASKLLEQHVAEEMEGIRDKMKPHQLWRSRAEYQEFPQKVFRKHIYQERTKQLAAPYWQHKRNKSAREKYEQKEKMLKEWNKVQIDREVQGLVEDWDKIEL